MKQATVTVSGQRVVAEVIRENPKTVLVKLPDRNSVKRHRVKHGVKTFTPALTMEGAHRVWDQENRKYDETVLNP